MAKSPVVRISIWKLTLTDPVWINLRLNQLVVKFQFLGSRNSQTETPYGIPVANEPRKTPVPLHFKFSVDLSIDNAESKTELHDLLMSANKRLKFWVLNEPNDEAAEVDCEIIAVAAVDLNNIVHRGSDIDSINCPVFLPDDQSKEVGWLSISVSCVDAVRFFFPSVLPRIGPASKLKYEKWKRKENQKNIKQ